MGRKRRRMIMRRRRLRVRGGMRRICMMEEGMIVKIPLLPLLQRLLQGSLQQEEVEEPHRRCTQRSNMNYQLTPEAPDHLTLATLPFFPEQCNHCGKNFLRKLSLSKHMLVVPQKYCKIPGQVDGTQKDQLCHMLNRLQD